jgi:hypothetical protein
MLTPLQKNVLLHVADLAFKAKDRFADGENAHDQINVAGTYAFALYTDLTTSGQTIKFSDTMLSNRGVSPDSPEFLRNFHALEDFVTIVNAIDQMK